MFANDFQISVLELLKYGGKYVQHSQKKKISNVNKNEMIEKLKTLSVCSDIGFNDHLSFSFSNKNLEKMQAPLTKPIFRQE